MLSGVKLGVSEARHRKPQNTPLSCFRLEWTHPSPLHVWTFDRDLGGWNNDNNNWKQKWTLEHEQGALCLLARAPSESVAIEAPVPWLTVEEKDEAELTNSNIQSRLWSPKVPTKVGMQCLTLAFKMSVLGSSKKENLSLFGIT